MVPDSSIARKKMCRVPLLEGLHHFISCRGGGGLQMWNHHILVYIFSVLNLPVGGIWGARDWWGLTPESPLPLLATPLVPEQINIP